MNKYFFHPLSFLRFPILDADLLNKLFEKMDNSDYSFMSDIVIREALYVANPEFFKMVDNQNLFDNNKIKITLAKYITRMCTNCTPFGLFAGCSIINLGDTSHLLEDKLSTHIVYARLNFSVFFRMYEFLEKENSIREKSRYILNPTLHHFEYNNSIRFLKFTFDHEKRDIKSQLIEIESDEYVENFLSLNYGISYLDLLELLIKSDIDPISARDYIDSLIDAGFFLNALLPSVSDVDYFDKFVKKIKDLRIDEFPYLSSLYRLHDLLLSIRKSRIGEIIEKAPEIERLIAIDLGISEKNILHVDLSYNLINNTINKAVFKNLHTAIFLFLGLMEKSINPILSNFIENFERRYGESKIPLKYFIDRDLGINLFFENATYTQDEESLFKNLKLEIKNVEKGKYTLPSFSQGFIRCIMAGEDFDLSTIDNNTPQIETSLISASILFTDKNCDNESLFCVKNITTKGFSNILGRFNYYDDDFYDFHYNLEHIEDSFADKNAEIVDLLHFPSIKTSNVVISNKHRRRHISVFSNYDEDKNIELDDLYLQLSGNQLMLKSFSTRKRILPKLSNAHNFSNPSSCQLYSLLALIGLQEFGFNGLRIKPFLDLFGVFPRIYYKNIIMVPRTWLLDPNIKTMSSQEILNYFEKKNLPSTFYLLDSTENDILITLKYDTSLKVFINTIQNCETVVIHECLWNFSDNKEKIFELFFGFNK